MNKTACAEPTSTTGELARQCLESFLMPSAVPSTVATNLRDLGGGVSGRWDIRSVRTALDPTEFEVHFLKVLSSTSYSDAQSLWLLSFSKEAKLSKRERARRRMQQWMNASVEEKQRQTQQMSELMRALNSERDEDAKIYR